MLYTGNVGWKKLLYVTAVVSLALAAALLILAVIFTGNTIRKGITIEQTDVSWLSAEEAKSIVSENMQRKYHTESLILTYDNRHWEMKLSDIEFRFLTDEEVDKAFLIGRTGNLFRRVYDAIRLSINGVQLEVGVSFKKVKLQHILEKIKKECDTVEKSAEITYKDGVVKFTSDTVGKRLDIDRNTDLVENHLRKKSFGSIELQIDEIVPHIMYDEIKEIQSVISQYSTRFSTSDSNRSDNIKLACSRIDNRIVLPGEEFSMNEALGPRTLDNGYKEAPIILKSELIPGTGGGVCQVSSTLYNSVLLAGLEITERVHHSIPLSYISPGRDATIAENLIDFRFINSSDYPICLQADVKGNKVSISILGKKKEDSNIIKIKTKIIEEYPPEPNEIVLDDSLQYGQQIVERKAIKGVRVVLYREYYNKDGELLWSEKLTEDYYKPVKGKVRVSRYLYDIYHTAENSG